MKFYPPFSVSNYANRLFGTFLVKFSPDKMTELLFSELLCHAVSKLSA